MRYLSAVPEVTLTAPGPKGRTRIALHVKGTHVPHRRAYTVTLTEHQERGFAAAVHDLVGSGVLPPGAVMGDSRARLLARQERKAAIKATRAKRRAYVERKYLPVESGESPGARENESRTLDAGCATGATPATVAK